MMDSDEQVEYLQKAIEESTQKLNDMIELKRFLDEEIHCMVTETNERKDLLALFQEIGVLESIQQFGTLLQKEKALTEQLNNEAVVERKELNDLHERIEDARTKKQSLVDKIEEMKQLLQEPKDLKTAAQGSNHTASTRMEKMKK
ncbi:uncharacterized protein LOC144204580 [Stigmatopora nigra]